MPERTLIGEFHSDHATVVQALMDLRNAIQDKQPGRVRETLGAANKLVGPHFKFEEKHLYPSLTEFVGEAGIERLLTEHDGVFRGVVKLVELAGKDAWSEADARSAAASLEWRPAGDPGAPRFVRTRSASRTGPCAGRRRR